MKTFMAKKEDIQRDWYLVDAEGMALGRLASQVAAILRGKNKAIFTPHVDTGDHVIIINTDKVVLTGKKAQQKVKKSYSGFPGGLKETLYSKYLKEKSDEAVTKAVQGMLPKSPLGRAMIKKLRVYKGAEHKHEAQTPQVVQLIKR